MVVKKALDSIFFFVGAQTRLATLRASEDISQLAAN
jgi:hypothetical protein